MIVFLYLCAKRGMESARHRRQLHSSLGPRCKENQGLWASLSRAAGGGKSKWVNERVGGRGGLATMTYLASLPGFHLNTVYGLPEM